MAKDHKITLTIKGTGGYDHPWLVFGGDDAAEVQKLLSDAHENDLFTAAGRAHAAFLRGAALGSELEATTTKVEKAPVGAFSTFVVVASSSEPRAAPRRNAACALGSELEATTTKVEKAPVGAPAIAPASPAAPAAEPEAPVAAPPIPEGAPKPAWKR